MTTPELGTLEDFMEMDLKSIIEIKKQYDISTIYIPVDGTRRYAMSILNGEEFTFEKYYKIVKKAFQQLLLILKKYSFSNIIILLHDQSSFNRGENYIKQSIKSGVSVFIEDADYFQFFKTNQINIQFVGFNDLYNQYYDETKLIFENIETNISNQSNSTNLYLYTGLSNSLDVLQLMNSYQKPNHNIQDIKIKLYGKSDLDIDISIYFGIPSNKIKPILISDNTIEFYSKSPSFHLTDIMVKKILYYTIIAKDQSIRNKFLQYDKIDITMNNDFWAEDVYSSDKINLIGK